MPDPTVYLLYNGVRANSSSAPAVTVTDGLSLTQSSSDSLQLSGPGDSAVFKYLNPNLTGYSIAVVAPGYQTYFQNLSGLTVAMTVTPPPALTAEAVLTGTVDSTINVVRVDGKLPMEMDYLPH